MTTDFPPDSECDCSTCQSYCVHKPGWFTPGEAERVAEHLGTTLVKLFESKLAVDWIDAQDEPEFEHDVFVLAPALVDETPGEEYPGNPRGTCVFFEIGDDGEGRCGIQPVKPAECRASHHALPPRDVTPVHLAFGKTWDTPAAQEQIQTLLGREPEKEAYEGNGIFGLLGFLS